jgi:hypothetical protein
MPSNKPDKKKIGANAEKSTYHERLVTDMSSDRKRPIPKVESKEKKYKNMPCK